MCIYKDTSIYYFSTLHTFFKITNIIYLLFLCYNDDIYIYNYIYIYLFRAAGGITCLVKMPSPNVRGSLSVLHVSKMGSGVSALGGPYPL